MPSPVGTRPRRTTALLATLCLAAPLAACGSSSPRSTDDASAAAGFPVTVENCGHDVTETAPPRRIVAINQPATELLLSLGLADRMAGYGVSDHDFLPGLKAEARRTKALDAEFPGFESMLSLEPDLVYATFAYAFTGEGVAPRRKFDEVGIPTYQSPSECGGQDAQHDEPLTLDDLYAEIGDVSRLTGVEDRGDRLVAELEAAGLDVLYDDRPKVSPGVKFKDAELLGMPTTVVVGKGLADGLLEVKDRASGTRRDVALADVITEVRGVCR